MHLRRLPFLVLVILLSFGLVSVVLAAAAHPSETIRHDLVNSSVKPAAQKYQSNLPTRHRAAAATLASLQLQVNYGHDWVAGNTDFDAMVAITVTDNVGVVKADSTLQADETGYFITACDSWVSGSCPDIQSGDRVFVSTFGTSSGASAEVNPIGSITGIPELNRDLITGTLTASWLLNPTAVFCQVWADPGTDPIETTANPNGGQFTCDFSGFWDLQKGDMVAMGYYEEDGDQVINMIEWPFLAANIGPWSDGNRHVWGNSTYPNASVELTVTTGLGNFIAGTTRYTDMDGYFSSGNDLPYGSLEPWNILHADFGGTITDSLTISPMSGSANPETDAITVTAAGPPTYTIDLEVCSPDSSCDWADLGEIGGSGVIVSNLLSDHGIDVEHGLSLNAHMHVENGHSLIYSWGLPAPELGLWKWHTGGYAQPGGVVVYGIHLRNDGDGPAENVFITDTLPANTTYSSDTSSFPVTVGPDGEITWDLGTINPAESVDFFVTLDVDSGLPIGQEIIGQNCALITTSTAGDWSPANDSSCSAAVDIWEDEVDLSVRKWAEPSDPHPGQEFDYWIEWCNLSGAAAGPVTMTDTLPVGVSLLSWQESEVWMHFWSEVSASDEQLVLYAPGLPGNRCEMINVRASLDASVSIPTKLVNLVDLAVGSDVNPENNWWVDDSAFASPPRYDLAIEKELADGVLVPGGYVDFWLRYRNQGNIETTVHITDTLPAGLYYHSGSWGEDTPWAGEPIPDPTIIGNQLVLDLPAVGINEQHSFSIRLAIDGGVEPSAYLVNCAEIAGEGPEASPADNNACTSFTIEPSGPNLQVEKWSGWQGEEQLGYTIHFANIGDQTVAGVGITDTLPVGVEPAGWPVVHFDDQRTGEIVDDTNSGRWLFYFSELYPGEVGTINFDVDLLEPGVPLRWFTNTVEISTPNGDTNPGNNFNEDTAFSGGEVKLVELWLNPQGVDYLWGQAVSGAPVTITTPVATHITFAGPDCDGCWLVENIGPLVPGDMITVSAGAGLHPVEIYIPDPFDVEASSTTDQVWGQIDHLDQEVVEVDMYGGPTVGTHTNSAGDFQVDFTELPPGAEGEVRYTTEVDFAEVVFHRYWRSPDLTLNINYGHDWVEGLYEPGHTVWITVTESDGSTVKGIAELNTDIISDWDRSGFSTDWGGWSSDRPNILPGDWVLTQLNNGYTATVQVGQVDISVNYPANVVTATIDFPDYLQPPANNDFLDGSCEIWGLDDGPGLPFQVDPIEEENVCDFNMIGWNIGAGQTVAVSYFEPDGHKVINTKDWPHILAHYGPASGGARQVWGHNAPLSVPITLTVQTESGEIVDSVSVTSTPLGDFDSGDSFFTDTLSAHNVILADFGHGMTDTLTIYPVFGEANLETNVITISVDAQPESTVNLVFCNGEECGESGLGEVGENDSLVIDMMELAEFDVTENSNFHPHFTVERNHILIYSWAIPPAEDSRRIYLPVALKNNNY